MQEKDTNELEQELGRTHLNDYVQYALKNKESMISDATSFSSYMKRIMRQRGISQQTAFLIVFLTGYSSSGGAMRLDALIQT